MHAALVKVRSDDFEAAQAILRSEVVPRVSQAPGFVAGYWLEPKDGQGVSLVVFESEEAARTAAEQLKPPAMVEIESIEVREVVAHA
jgi:hypothetical protein